MLTFNGNLWTYHAPGSGAVPYDWRTGRAHDCLDAVLRAPDTDPCGGDFAGILQSDGYGAYRAWLDKQAGDAIVQLSCLAHIRRGFHEARGDHPRITALILRRIGHLYRIEERLREARAGPALREAVRRSESLPIHRRLARAFAKLHARHAITPRSPLGRALSYALKQWPMLLPAIEDGRAELDNRRQVGAVVNLVENAIRPTKLGAKNWLCVSRKEVDDVEKAA